MKDSLQAQPDVQGAPLPTAPPVSQPEPPQGGKPTPMSTPSTAEVAVAAPTQEPSNSSSEEPVSTPEAPKEPPTATTSSTPAPAAPPEMNTEPLKQKQSLFHRGSSSKKTNVKPILNKQQSQMAQLRIFWLSTLGIVALLFGGLLYYGFGVYTDVSLTLGQVQSIILLQQPSHSTVIDFDTYDAVVSHETKTPVDPGTGAQRNPFQPVFAAPTQGGTQ